MYPATFRGKDYSTDGKPPVATEPEAGYCADCGARFVPKGCAPGYAQLGNGPRICYTCAAKMEKAFMREKGRITLYLSEPTGAGMFRQWSVSNWPGSLRFSCGRATRQKVWAGFCGQLDRVDVWFAFEGYVWHGVHQGHNHDLVHCRRTKQQAL